MDFLVYLVSLLTFSILLQNTDALCPRIHHIHQQQSQSQRQQIQSNHHHNIAKRSIEDSRRSDSINNNQPSVSRSKLFQTRSPQISSNSSAETMDMIARRNITNYGASIDNGTTTSTLVNSTTKFSSFNGSGTDNYGSKNDQASTMNLNDINKIRLEYYKYRIMTQLGITETPNSTLMASVSSPTELSLNLDKSLTRNRRNSQLSISSFLPANPGDDSMVLGTLTHKKRATVESVIGTPKKIYSNLSDISYETRSISVQQLIEEQARIDSENSEYRHPRQKRSLDCSQVKNDKDACCLDNFHVNFTDIGWDKWILYPSGYDANYCRGQCDLSHARYYHSTLLSKFSSVIGLCCSPRTMAPLSLLYIDEDNKVHQKLMPDMIVKSCDCA